MDAVTVSSNTLFHFTDSAENLVSILADEFRPRFCLEIFNSIVADRDPPELAVPMVCFCDLPLSQTGTHLSIYGNYGIGLSKQWAKRNGVAPVLYTYPASLVARALQSVVGRLNKGPEAEGGSNEILDDLYDFACYIKPYEGDFWRRGRVIPNVRFYNEREWRYIPKMDSEFFRFGMVKEHFLDPDQRSVANEEIAKRAVLSFEPSDIRYIIVEREEEILPTMEQIERIKRKFSYDDVRLLMSRIVSAEQIREDF